MGLTITDFFYLFKVFLQKYTLDKETPEDKKIAKMLIEEYIQSGHNFYQYLFELQAVKKSEVRYDLAGQDYG